MNKIKAVLGRFLIYSVTIGCIMKTVSEKFTDRLLSLVFILYYNHNFVEGYVIMAIDV
jgi:hypothetical protein